MDYKLKEIQKLESWKGLVEQECRGGPKTGLLLAMFGTTGAVSTLGDERENSYLII